MIKLVNYIACSSEDTGSPGYRVYFHFRISLKGGQMLRSGASTNYVISNEQINVLNISWGGGGKLNPRGG